MLLAFTSHHGIIFPFAALREVYHEKGSLSIHLYCIGASDKVTLCYKSTEDALKIYNRYIKYLTVPNPSSAPI